MHAGGGGDTGNIVAVGSDFIFGIWRIGGGKCAVVVARDDGASKRVGIGARVDEWRRNAVVCIAGRGVRGISGRNLCGCGAGVSVRDQVAAAVGEDRGPSGGKLDCGERVVATGVGGEARVNCFKGEKGIMVEAGEGRANPGAARQENCT